MVEIALCLAIVGFALVAIIGVLPAGLNVQKENREDTILNQDATVWLDAIRSGSQGYDELTNYVDRIRVESYRYDTSNTVTPVKLADLVGEQQAGAGVDVVITNGQLIVGLLSTPRIYRAPNLAADGGFVSNYVTAYVRAINSSAADAPPQDNLNVRDLSFRYRMVVEVSPVTSFDPELIQTNATDHVLRDNLSDVRLLFRWPLKQPFSVMPAPDPVAGNSRMSFRTQVGGPISLVANADYPKVPFFFLQPRQFQ